MQIQPLGQARFSNRVIHAKITAPTNTTTILPITPPPAEMPSIPNNHPPQNASKDAEDNIRHDAVATAFHHSAGEPPRVQPDHDPVQYSAHFSLL
jgi:hypothetical protein